MVLCIWSGPGEESDMDSGNEHPVARMDDTVTARNLHERAEAVAVPNFDYLGQTIAGVVAGLTERHRHHDGAPKQP
jgi:hypothetical protein